MSYYAEFLLPKALSNFQTSTAIDLFKALSIVPSDIAANVDSSAVLFFRLEIRSVERSPLLLVISEVLHEDASQFNDKRDDHENETEDEREAEVVGSVLKRCACHVVYPELLAKILRQDY